jgi:succinyl-diaminopimelate desuccinylase
MLLHNVHCCLVRGSLGPRWPDVWTLRSRYQPDRYGCSMPERIAIDPVDLTRQLIRCASVTPDDDGALDLVQSIAEQLGFTVHRLEFDGTPNLFARRGDSGPHFCFAGHTDVVPPGSARWLTDPFEGVIRDGAVYGRGASDMKGAIAAFLAALSLLPSTNGGGDGGGSVSMLITGDEEGPATGGTVRVLEWMAEHGHIPDFCVVGEASNPTRIGEEIKNGRRGSLNATISVAGTQGHVAYPARVDNPVHRLVGALAELVATSLDEGTGYFEPSTLQVTTVDVGNTATNLVPASASAQINIRFNDLHTGRTLEKHLRTVLARHCERFTLDATISGEAFVTDVGSELRDLAAAIAGATGIAPVFSTGGGTSDARFISRYCPVAEFGLTSETIHQIDEHVRIEDVRLLSRAYLAALTGFLRE